MTVDQWIKKQQKKLDEIVRFNRPLAITVRSMVAVQAKRIFTDGMDGNGGVIGSYNNKTPFYVSDKNSPRQGNHKGKTGNTIKTTYYKSYKDFKQKMQGQSNFVNLRLFNELQSDFSNANVQVLGGRGSARHNPVKITPNEYHITLRKDINVKKKNGLEEKYGEIFKLTDKERQLFFTNLQKEVNIAMAK